MTTARSDSSAPSSPSTTSASAPTGAEQPASSVGEQGPLGGDAGAGVGVVEGGDDGCRDGVVGAALDGERALAGGGQHLDRVEHLGGLVERPSRRSPARASTTASSWPSATLPQPGVDVAAEAGDDQAEAEGVELGGAARRAGADAGAGRQLAEGEAVAGDERVARVLAGGHGGERECRRRAWWAGP